MKNKQIKETKVQRTRVAIVGGGLAGLHAANQLKQKNIPYQLFDSKALLGGRIAGMAWGTDMKQFHDLGPTWVFSHHKLMQALVTQMGLELFRQHTQGDVLYQFENIKAPRRVHVPPVQAALRIKGGTYALITKMVSNLEEESLNTKHKIISIVKSGKAWKVGAIVGEIAVDTFCEHVVIALPPRIIARDFAKATWMNNVLAQQLTQSQTWMSAQAKIIITYIKPFWREQGLSGQVLSQVGPIVEIHDACLSDEEGFALFGFIGIPATQRIRESQKELKKECIKQLADIFGHDAYRFEKCFLKDWANDADVCTGQDQSEGSRHPLINMHTCESALLGENLYLAGSEFASAEAGYLEGALVSANSAILKLAARL
jgi:monoamine oxidase